MPTGFQSGTIVTEHPEGVPLPPCISIIDIHDLTVIVEQSALQDAFVYARKHLCILHHIFYEEAIQA